MDKKKSCINTTMKDVIEGKYFNAYNVYTSRLGNYLQKLYTDKK